jgi:S-adenosylmethionine hydrolase
VHLITLTTDLGVQDWFVGTMKGVILGINRQANIVDLSHEIPPGDIRAGAFALASSYRFFPKGTVHVAVVDPGVGGARRAIAVQTIDYFFVGPDNGVLSYALAKEKLRSVRRLDHDRLFLTPVSHTFHGRDVFAPVAAHLSRGISMGQLGSALREFVRLPWRKPRVRPGSIAGEIIYLDRFGNAITNIENASLPPSGECEVFRGRKRLCPVKAFYQSVPTGRPVAVPGSSGFVEVAVNGGSAADQLRLKLGAPLVVRAAVRAVRSR